MSNYFSLEKDAKDFKKSGFLGKVGNAALIAGKITANIGIFTLSTMMDSVEHNVRKNGSAEQKAKFNECKNFLNQDRSKK